MPALKQSVKSADAAAHGPSAGFKTFDSPASKAIRLQKAAAAGSGVTQSPETAKAAVSAGAQASSSTAIYVSAYTPNGCASGTGAGTASDPYCMIQDGVDAAQPGDTVYINGSQGFFSAQNVTVTTSDISIVGVGDQAWNNGTFTLDDVTGVTISNLMDEDTDPAFDIIGSSDITLDSDYISGASGGVEIDGASKNVTVSRTYIDTSGWSTTSSGISIAAGATNITLASDVLAATYITATGVNGLDVVGNTIQRGCSSAVDVEGTSTGVSIENNLFEDTNPNTDYMWTGSTKSSCQSTGPGWAPDVTVGAQAAPATTADFNDFYVFGLDVTAPYSWAGITYATLAAFQQGAGQGAHDTDDATEAKEDFLRPNTGAEVDMVPVAGSAAIDSANTSAPGEPGSDFFGVSPYDDRGAVEFSTPDPDLAVSISGEQTSAFGVSVTANVTSTSGVALDAAFAWGDGTTTVGGLSESGTQTETHSYATLGSYTVTVTYTDNDGDAVTNTLAVSTAGSEYTAYGPARLLDTRSGIGGVTSPLTSAAPIRLQIAGNGAIPADATAVALNVTVANATADGNVAVNPDGVTPSGTSNVNYTAGQTVANMVIVPIGADGYVSFTNQGTGSVAVIADAGGYFTQSAAAGYTATTPTRILDTRDGTGTGGVVAPLTSAAPIKLQIAANGQIPHDVTAVALNLTLTDSTGNGNVIAYPDGSTQPITSNLNYTAGLTVANAAIVPVTDGYIDLAEQGPGSVDMIADVEGYFDSAEGTSAYLPVAPKRLFDSRKITNGQLPAGDYYGLGIDLDSSGAVLPGVTSLVLNTTVTDVTGVGFLTVFPDNDDGPNGSVALPNASTLNFAAGATVPNLTFATPGADGMVDFYNGAQQSSLDLIVDIFGYYQDN